ncbi:MAG: hypothetical protein KJO21_01145 [Verrucomicrobiae bacterium]|nr:hypothetical protein [Verrucomicrobiae bacterium]NNJ42140.1 hypothetical protein [Akkermansiaceae bacterium]
MNSESPNPLKPESTPTLNEGVDNWSALLQHSEAELAKTQEQIDEIAYELYGIEGDDRASIEAMMDTSKSDMDEGDEAETLITADPATLTSELLDYCVGVVFGRWDIRYATGEKPAPPEPDPFEALPLCAPGMLQNDEGLPAKPEEVDTNYPIRISWNGILVEDAAHNEDIFNRTVEALTVMWGEQSGAIQQEACEMLKVKKLRDYFAEKKAGGKFFKEHLSRFSKSRRKAPIYWPLSTESGTYTLWFYYHRLDSDTLYTAVSFIEDKQEEVAKTFADLSAKKSRTKEEDKELEAAQLLVAELPTFRESLLDIAKFWKPNLNDGVQITAAPLWKHFRLKTWQKLLKTTWTKLEKGEYDWAHLAHSTWPERVIPKCLTDRSLAIAHGHDDALWEPYTDDRGKEKWRLKKDAKETVEQLVKKNQS